MAILELANSSAIDRIFDEVFPNGYSQTSLVVANSDALYAASWAVQRQASGR